MGESVFNGSATEQVLVKVQKNRHSLSKSRDNTHKREKESSVLSLDQLSLYIQRVSCSVFSNSLASLKDSQELMKRDQEWRLGKKQTEGFTGIQREEG